MGFEFLRFTPV